VEVAGKFYKAQSASAVLCYSRMLFFQIYPAFTGCATKKCRFGRFFFCGTLPSVVIRSVMEG